MEGLKAVLKVLMTVDWMGNSKAASMDGMMADWMGNSTAALMDGMTVD